MRVSVPRRRKDIGNERGDGAKVGRKLGRGPGRPPFKLPKIPPPPMLKTDAADLDPQLSGGLFWTKNYRLLPRRKRVGAEVELPPPHQATEEWLLMSWSS